VEIILLVEGDGSARWIARNLRDARDSRVPKTANRKKAAWRTGSHVSPIDLLAGKSSQPRLDALARQWIDRRPRLSWWQVACPASLSLPPTQATPTPNDAWQSARSIRPDHLLRAVRKAVKGLPHGG
jgi:hypothetical protein